MRKRVIEWNIPLSDISKASTHEKSVRHGHPSTLHLWWARRPLAASRTTTFASLVDLSDDTQEQQRIENLIRNLAPWNILNDEENPVLTQSQSEILKQWKQIPPKILDPFSGGGSIPLEALRLGCETYASDINPIAVLIGKATLEWPQQLANKKLSSFVKKQAEIIRNRAHERIGHLYPQDKETIPIGYLWARIIQCTNPLCQFEIPLIKHFWLARKKSRKIAYKPSLDLKSRKIKFKIQMGDEIDFNPSEGTIIRANARCLSCGLVIRASKVRAIAQEGGMTHRMLIIILRSIKKSGKIYRIVSEKDEEVMTEAEKIYKSILESSVEKEVLIPDENLPPKGTLGFGVQQYGMTKWIELFNSRQILSHIIFAEEIRNHFPIIESEIKSVFPEDPKTGFKAVCAYLTLIFGRLLDKNANLVIYNAYGEKIEHVFGRTALPMAWDYVELNVFSGANGDWSRQTDWVVRFLESNFWKAKTHSAVNLVSATNLPYPSAFFDAILTDPPYYDNVPYSDLSDFFYVWFKRILGNIFPTIFATPLTPKLKELVANKGRQKNPRAHFEQNLLLALQEMHRTLKPEGIALFVYAHKSITGWASFLSSLMQAGFTVTASWPINTEMKTRLRARTSAALASSIYLICRKLPQEEIGYLSDLQNELKNNVYSFLNRFWREGIKGGDFFIAAIGPAMNVLSRFKEVRRYSGERVTMEEQLNIIRTISTNFLLQNLLQERTPILLDKLAQFYLAFRWTYQNKIVDFGEVQVLGQACGINLDKLALKDDLVQKKGSKLVLIDPIGRKQIKVEKNDYVNLMHALVNAWNKNDLKMIDRLSKKHTNMISPTFWQFCQAVAECLPLNNSEKHLIEGFLSSQETWQFTREV